MTKPAIKFYLLENTDTISAWCQLTQFYYKNNHRIWIHCESIAMAEALDEAIWQITPFSFIPHHLDNEGPNPPAPIILSAGGKRPFYFDILFNASNHIAPFHDKFKHIIEIVPNCDDAKQGLREKFKQYRQAQWLVETESLMTMTDKAPYAIQET